MYEVCFPFCGFSGFLDWVCSVPCVAPCVLVEIFFGDLKASVRSKAQRNH